MRPPLRSLVAVVVAMLACSVALTGCFTTSADYQRDAKKFILTDEDLRAELFGEAGSGSAGETSATEFASAVCEDPQNQDPGTTFICNARDDAGGDWEFQITIEDSHGYSVNVSRRPTG